MKVTKECSVDQALGGRLEELIQNDKKNYPTVVGIVLEESRHKEMLRQDEEEDFLDECESLKKYFSSKRIFLFATVQKYLHFRLLHGKYFDNLKIILSPYDVLPRPKKSVWFLVGG